LTLNAYKAFVTASVPTVVAAAATEIRVAPANAQAFPSKASLLGRQDARPWPPTVRT